MRDKKLYFVCILFFFELEIDFACVFMQTFLLHFVKAADIILFVYSAALFSDAANGFQSSQPDDRNKF